MYVLANREHDNYTTYVHQVEIRVSSFPFPSCKSQKDENEEMCFKSFDELTQL